MLVEASHIISAILSTRAGLHAILYALKNVHCEIFRAKSRVHISFLDSVAKTFTAFWFLGKCHICKLVVAFNTQKID